MLSRLLTRREQLVLVTVATGLIIGSAVLLVTRQSAEGEPSTVTVVRSVRDSEPAQAAEAASAVSGEVIATVVPPPPPAPPTPAKASVKVAVRGAVLSPGLYEFDSDARVQEAVDRAGGPVEAADLSDINLAARLMDGTTLTVPERPETPAPGRLRLTSRDAPPVLNPPEYTLSGWRPQPAAAPVAAETAAPGAVVTGGVLDLNTATATQLETLPGIGPKLAGEIVRYRESGRFLSVDDLENVTGIGPKRLEAIRPFIAVQ